MAEDQAPYLTTLPFFYHAPDRLDRDKLSLGKLSPTMLDTTSTLDGTLWGRFDLAA